MSAKPVRTILDIVNRVPEPAPWSEGDNIPWHEPGFSERMLAHHLSQEHDLASRRSTTIDEHVDWIFSTVLDGRPARVLDLGCGPGLYAHRLAMRGCECVGIDFSPASIRHAQEVAADQGLACRFLHADLRDAPFGEGFNLVMMIFGQLNVFQRNQAMEILGKAHAALVPGGSLLLEVQDGAQIQKDGKTAPGWYAAPSGLFSDRPHLVLQESFWNDKAAASTTRFLVIDAETAAVSSFALSNEAYTEEELETALHAVGFSEVQRVPTLRGRKATEATDLPVVLARRHGGTT